MRDARLTIMGSQRLAAALTLLALLGGGVALGGRAATGGTTPGEGALGGGALGGATVLPRSAADAHTDGATAEPGAPAGNAQRGKRLYLAVGCYECHGTTGAGATTGPQIAPNPVPFPAFVYQLRHPLGSPPYGNIKMPRYGETVLSDSQAADIYAYLASIGPSPPASKIPLLNP